LTYTKSDLRLLTVTLYKQLVTYVPLLAPNLGNDLYETEKASMFCMNFVTQKNIKIHTDYHLFVLFVHRSVHINGTENTFKKNLVLLF